MAHTPALEPDWIPVMAPNTMLLDMDMTLSCSLIAWLLSKLQKETL